MRRSSYNGRDMDAISTLQANGNFINEVYNLQVLGLLIPFLMALIFWEMAWKGVALWRASKLSMTGWFITMLVVNSVGILPIIFILTTKAQYNALKKEESARELKKIAAEVEAEKRAAL